MNQEELKELEGEIGEVVDKWLSEVMKGRLISGTNSPAPRSLWDRLKHGIKNWWYGPQGEKENPYRWQNRFGSDLGSSVKQESFDPTAFTLHEYAEIKGIVDSLERRICESNSDFENLKIYQIMKSAAEELKKRLFYAFKNKFSSLSATPAGSTTAVGASSGDGGEEAILSNTSPVPADSKTSNTARPVAKGDKAARPVAKGDKAARPVAKGDKAARPVAKGDKAARPVAKQIAGSIKTSDKEAEAEVATNKNDQLAGYLQDEKRGERYEVGEAVKKIVSFLRSIESFKKNEVLKNWWKNLAEKYSKDTDSSNSIWKDLVASDAILDGIEKATSVPKADIKKMMIDHLEGRNQDGGGAIAQNQPDEEKDEGHNLGLEAYFTTNGAQDDPNQAITKIERFLANPMASIGSSTQPDIIKALSAWWSGVKEDMKKSPDKKEFLARNMSERADDPDYVPPLVSQIADVMKKNPKFVSNLMRTHIRKKSNR
jgi:hypothetical protein